MMKAHILPSGELMQLSALVTGSSRGIGRAIAVALAARGVRLALHCQSNIEAADETRRALSGDEHIICKADLSDAAAVGTLWAEVSQKIGPVDILVNNAGIYVEHPALETELEAWLTVWQRTLAINLIAPAHLSYLALRDMAARGSGRIVNISSRGAFRGEPLGPAYGASKAGLNSLGQSLAKALARHNVGVFTIAPGWVETDMASDYLLGEKGAALLADQPLGRIAKPAEVADVVAFCALDAPQSMTGGVIDVNGASYLRT